MIAVFRALEAPLGPIPTRKCTHCRSLGGAEACARFRPSKYARARLVAAHVSALGAPARLRSISLVVPLSRSPASWALRLRSGPLAP